MMSMKKKTKKKNKKNLNVEATVLATITDTGKERVEQRNSNIGKGRMTQ